nr:fibrous sheath CABYR-binding protein [Manis javanica]
MVDKSQQTEVAEKKKQLPIPQSSGSQATISIGNIPGSNINYGSLRISSQLQTWKKRRKYIRDMTDKSLQTDTTEEEKKEAIKAVDETVMPEEKPAAVREGDPEFPESVQEVEISPRRHSVQLKIHRSQQTSCTGVWTMMNIPQKETVDKEQQTDLSESEIMFFGKPGSSFSKSKEGTRKCKSSGDIFVSENPEFQSITSNNEETGQSISKFLFIQQSKNGNTAYLEDEQDISVAVQPTTAGEISAEVQPPATDEAPAEEASAKVEPTPAEEMFSEEPPAEVQPPSTNESSTQEAQELQLPPAEETPAEEASAEVQHSAAEETPTEGASAEVLPLPAEEPPAEETSDEVQSLTAEETHAEEASAEVLPPPAEESPVEEATAEVQPPLDEETSSEEASAEDDKIK